MKKYLFPVSLIVCFFAWFFASVYVLAFVGTIGSGTQPTAPYWVYTNTGGDTYDDTDSEAADNAICGPVVISETVDITKIGVKVSTTGSGTYKTALFDTDGNRLFDCGEDDEPDETGWDDMTCDSSYEATADTYIVCYNTDNGTTAYHHNTGTGYWSAATYSTFPAASYVFTSDSGKLNALRVYCE